MKICFLYITYIIEKSIDLTKHLLLLHPFRGLKNIHPFRGLKNIISHSVKLKLFVVQCLNNNTFVIMFSPTG